MNFPNKQGQNIYFWKISKHLHPTGYNVMCGIPASSMFEDKSFRISARILQWIGWGDEFMSINRLRISGAIRKAIRDFKNQPVPSHPTHNDMAAFLADAPPDRQTEFETRWNEFITRIEQELANSQAQEPRPQPDYVEDLRILVRHPLLSRKVGIPEAARLVGVGQCKFRKLVSDGRIPVIRCGVKMLFHPADLEKYVESQRVTMTGCRPAPLKRSLPDRVIKSPYLKLNTLG